VLQPARMSKRRVLQAAGFGIGRYRFSTVATAQRTPARTTLCDV